ncbi:MULTISPECIES: 2-hydroxychromene-2-carboxylate isomerase [Roseomonadaceae]|uniref:2-hydroxychromene-2-carboxylate isomerase n=1 Tax=Falsiroseomonas oleicola TaxID=2801474 RepID=A0ABS6H4D7_9PROT|nr:2-hydroxychromene-2-carboxylate isomerase [Roseomonas oleicola]MBU8543543.1 2-hydroxychromene-2-carboxylate isomerase [Roseomonas oleicola]
MRIDYFYSLGSPFSFLGHAAFQALAARHDAEVRHLPVNLEPIFAATGGLKLPDRAPARQVYRLVELARWGRRRGIPILLDPHCHGVSRELGAGLVIAAQRAGRDPFPIAEWVMSACWLRDRDIAAPDMLAEFTDRFDGAALVAAATSPAILEEWHANTRQALAAGVFGAPTYALAGEIFWGQDQLAQLEEALQHPSSGRDT